MDALEIFPSLEPSEGTAEGATVESEMGEGTMTKVDETQMGEGTVAEIDEAQMGESIVAEIDEKQMDRRSRQN